jgi:molecular chaperone HtpG
MEKLIKQLKGNAKLLSSIQNCVTEVTPILQGYITNFPDFTDHSINHSMTVLRYTELLLGNDLKKLNADEIYILIISGLLHDIGMCPTPKMKKEIKVSATFKDSGKKFEDYLREIHQEVSYEYINTHWEKLGIINETYSEAIGLIARGHRVVDLSNFEKYEPEYPVKSGTDFVCLPYLASLLRLSDELDITNDRTPELLFSEYLPTNKISRQEWEKHKANYFVTFNRQIIKITSKCYNKDLYFALLKHYNKIDSVIKYVQKVVNNIPQNERGLKIDYLKLDKDIKTIGFIPMEIGFSFDLQNTISTFIGNNIYKDKLVAIRECLQNAIDTCRYRQYLSKGPYSPDITVNLVDKQLIVSDNGLGMDELIVENYFSKLAKSYYLENKVSKEFEAISQFGIGVFSYFLLCDYFEVESKQEGKSPIKFRASKDTDSYFYFYDNPTRCTSGTTITFFLSDELTFDDLLDQVKYYIRFVEFPIKIIYNERHETITSDSFILDPSNQLGSHIGREYLEALRSLEVVDTYISTKEFEGIFGLLFSKDNKGRLIPIHSYDTLSTYQTSNIEISQKGIFIGNTRDWNLNNIIGKINFKHKTDIDLGRYHLKKTEQVEGVFEQFYYNIFKKIFTNWEGIDPLRRTTLSTDLIRYYFEYYQSVNLSLFEHFNNEIYFALYDNDHIQYLSLKEILKYKEVIIVNDETPFSSGRIYNYSTVNEIYNELHYPLILQNRGVPATFLFEFFKSRNNHIEIKCTNKHWYFLIKTTVNKLVPTKSLPPRYLAYSFDKPHICAYTGLLIEKPFNLDHEIIKYYITNIEYINKQQRLYKQFEEFFKDISSFMYNFHSRTSRKINPSSEIVYLNSILNNINQLQGTSFMLSKKDFPEWINNQFTDN